MTHLATGPVSTTTKASWYVVHTKPRQESVARDQLRRQAFEVYLPLFKVLRSVRRDSVLAAREPMFPRYLFLRPMRPTQSLSVVRSTVGVSRLVMFGTQPATLADEAVEAIRRAETLRESASQNSINPYQPGMSVRIKDPALLGVQALVQSVSRDRVTLLLEILGGSHTLQVEFGQITPL